MGSGGGLVGNMLARLWATRLQAAATAPPTAPDGIDADGVEAWFALNVPSAEPAARLRADRRRPLEPDLPRQRRRRPAAGRCAGRRSASGSAPPTTWRASTRSSPRSGRPTVPVAPVVGLCEDESVNGAPFYVMEFVEGPILRGLAEAEAFPDEADRRAIGERVADTLVGDPRRRPRRGRARRPRPQGGLRRPPAAPLAGPVGEVEDARAGGDRRRPRAARRPHPRAGPGDDRPRRLPPRQHDPHPDRRGRRGRRLGALHARRPARRRRPADGLLARAGAGRDRPRPARQPRPRLPDPRGAGRPLRRALRPRPLRPRLLRRPRLLEAGDHPRGRLRPLRRRRLRQGRRRASRPSPGWSSAWPRPPTRPSGAADLSPNEVDGVWHALEGSGGSLCRTEYPAVLLRVRPLDPCPSTPTRRSSCEADSQTTHVRKRDVVDRCISSSSAAPAPSPQPRSAKNTVGTKQIVRRAP